MKNRQETSVAGQHRERPLLYRSASTACQDMRTNKARAVDPLGSMPSTNTPVYAAHSRLLSAFDSFSSHVTRWAGSPIAFAGALCLVIVWAALGRVFDYSENWQLVINTGTTIVTFLMVFLIQRTQNHDNEAVQLKLNELVAALDGASNHLINIEELTEDELRTIHRHFHQLARLARDDASATTTHSVEEAETRHKRKVSRR